MSTSKSDKNKRISIFFEAHERRWEKAENWIGKMFLINWRWCIQWITLNLLKFIDQIIFNKKVICILWGAKDEWINWIFMWNKEVKEHESLSMQRWLTTNFYTLLFSIKNKLKLLRVLHGKWQYEREKSSSIDSDGIKIHTMSLSHEMFIKISPFTFSSAQSQPRYLYFHIKVKKIRRG